jgi:uncharacterized membrane protein HdeD (DUF308 family)
MTRNPIFRGILSLLFFAVALLMPDTTLLSIALVFGVYAFIDGISRVVAAFRQSNSGQPWLASLLWGLMGIAAGIFAVSYPGMALLVMTVIVAVWAIATGFIELRAAVLAQRATLRYRVSLAIIGLGSIVLGSVMFIAPTLGIVTLLTLLASYALVSGLFLLMAGFELRSGVKRIRIKEAKGEKSLDEVDEESKRAA